MTRIEELQAASRERHANDSNPVAETEHTEIAIGAQLLEAVIEEAEQSSEDERAHSKEWDEFLKSIEPGETRPDCYPFTLRHRNGTRCPARDGKSRKCICPKWGQPRGGGNDSRFSMFCNTWKTAELRIEQYMNACHRPTVEQTRKDIEASRRVKMQIIPGFTKYANFMASGKRKRGSDESADDTLKNVLRQGKQLDAFLQKYNAARPKDEPIEYFHQLTHNLLQEEWRPHWSVKSAGTINAFIRRLAKVMHYAMEHRWMDDSQKIVINHRGRGKCNCIVHQMPMLDDAEEDSKRMPFNDQPNPEDHGGNASWQTDLIYAACPKLATDERPDLGTHMHMFLRACRETGARGVDVALMDRRDIDVRTLVWKFQPLKTKYTTKVWVSMPLTPDLYLALCGMPLVPGADPNYFFYTGNAKLQNAADPWKRDLLRLWPLVSKKAGLKEFVDENGDEAWGIFDTQAKKLVRIGCHTFRHTYVCEQRIKGTSYADIAELIGDLEKTVVKYYKHYTRSGVHAVAAAARKTWSEKDQKEYAQFMKRQVAMQAFERGEDAPVAQ